MRITLIQPPQGSRFGFTKVLLIEPLGLECVAAAMKLLGTDGGLETPLDVPQPPFPTSLTL